MNLHDNGLIIGFYLMHQWLAGFYYRTTIGWEVFAITFLVSIVIAWISVGFKAVRAAIRNPVESLRAE